MNPHSIKYPLILSFAIFCLLSSVAIGKGIPAKVKKESDPEIPCSRSVTINWTASYFCIKSNTWMQQSSSSTCTSSSTLSCDDAQSKANSCATALAATGKTSALTTMASICNPPLN